MIKRPALPVIAVLLVALALTAPRAAAYVTWDESVHGPLPAATASSSALDDDILPVTDGSIYSASSAVTNQFILVSASVQGALEFAALDAAPYLSFHLALNPYALPLLSPTVDVYGYGNADGAITGADYNAGGAPRGSRAGGAWLAGGIGWLLVEAVGLWVGQNVTEGTRG